MKYSTDQLILAAHVRTIALDFRQAERNSLSDKWHTENPGKSREMAEFAAELKPMNDFVLKAAHELENIMTVILAP